MKGDFGFPVVHTNGPHCKANGGFFICDEFDAKKYGFIIDGPIAFIWETECGLLCLSYVPNDSLWAATLCCPDMHGPDTMTTYMSANSKFHTLFKACEYLYSMLSMDLAENASFEEKCKMCGFTAV